MKSKDKCPNCGANIDHTNATNIAKCPYCNSSFRMDNISDENNTTNSIEDIFKKSEINIVLLIALFVINPIIAIIYLVIKSNKSK